VPAKARHNVGSRVENGSPGEVHLSSKGGEMTPVLPRGFIALLVCAWNAGYGGCSTNGSIVDTNEKLNSSAQETADLGRLRALMVRNQLQGRDVKDPRVLAAMLKVPRHDFVPRSLLGAAYEDSALPLMLGQTISQPYIVGYMTQALGLKGSERVLEIGTGSGYQAAVLAELAREVFTVEIIPELTERAQQILSGLGYKNIHFKTGDGYAGWPEFSPFDAIIVTAAPDHVPQPLIDQLQTGGKMIIPVGRFEQDLILVEKGPTGVTRRSTIPVRFVPMTGKAQQSQPR
jgi:protein-L-isoaspartate(D-aspartate) O-methyltransferase